MGTSETHAAVTNGSPPCGGSVAKIFCGSRSTFVDQEMGRLRIVPGVPRTSATTPRQEGQYDVVAMCLPCRARAIMVHWGTLGSSQKSCFGPSFLGRIIKSFRRLHRSPFSHSGPTDPTNHKRSTFFCFGALECRESRPQHATSAVSKHVAAACLPHARHTTLSTSNTASLFPTCYPPGLKRFRSLAKHKVSETSMDRCFVCGTPLRPNSVFTGSWYYGLIGSMRNESSALRCPSW